MKSKYSSNSVIANPLLSNPISASFPSFGIESNSPQYHEIQLSSLSCPRPLTRTYLKVGVGCACATHRRAKEVPRSFVSEWILSVDGSRGPELPIGSFHTKRTHLLVAIFNLIILGYEIPACRLNTRQIWKEDVYFFFYTLSSSSLSWISAFDRKKCYFPAMSLEVACYKYPAINTKFHITYKQWPTVIPYHWGLPYRVSGTGKPWASQKTETLTPLGFTTVRTVLMRSSHVNFGAENPTGSAGREGIRGLGRVPDRRPEARAPTKEWCTSQLIRWNRGNGSRCVFSMPSKKPSRVNVLVL